MSSITNTSTVLETTEPRAHSVVLSLLAALSASFPVAGKDGAGAVSKQLSDLLQAKTVPLSELSLLYCYKFGFSIGDALKYVGFKGNVQDFLEQDDAFTLQTGLVSLCPTEQPSHSHAWCNVGSRVAAAFKELYEEESDVKLLPEALLVLRNDGEAALAMQLSQMLQEKTMSVSQLSLLYCYKFGFTISDALTTVGFMGKFEDFLQQREFATVHNGLVSLCLNHSIPQQEPSKPKANDGGDSIDDQSTTGSESNDLDMDTDTNITQDDTDASIQPYAWHHVGSRIASAFKDIDEDESWSLGASIITTPSLPDVDDGYEGDGEDGQSANPAAWSNVGSRIVAALEDINEDCDLQELPNPSAWCNAGSRIAAALKEISEDPDDDHVSDESPNPAGWCNVGSRIATALNDIADDDDLDEQSNPMGWCHVSSRIAAAFRDSAADDDFQDSTTPSAWSDVGSRLSAAFSHGEEQSSEGDISADA